MARKERNSVDYFPHSVIHGKKMFYIRNKYKNDGYATWFILLEKLGSSEYHYLDLKEEIELMYLSSEIMVEHDTLNNIINDLVSIGEFDKELWDNEKILFNQKFIENIQDAYKKRNNECINKESLIQLLSSKGRSLSTKSISKQPKGTLKDNNNTQSKVEYNKVEESKEKKESDFIIFWDKYNKKQDSKKCKEKFLKLSNEEIEKILLVVDNYVKSTPDIKFRKNPATWLNGSCWNDSIVITSNNKEVINPDNERIVVFNTNVNGTVRKLPESKFLQEQENYKDGGYIYKVLKYE